MAFDFNSRFASVGEVILSRASDSSGNLVPIHAWVLDREFKPYEPWTMPQTGTIASGVATAFTEIKKATTGGYWLQAVDQDQMGHYFVGVTPDDCKVYWEYPVGKKIGQLLDLSVAGDAAGGVPGFMLPYLDPSPTIEFLTLANVTTPAFAILNTGTLAKTYKLHFLGCWYKVRWLDPETPKDKNVIDQAAALGVLRYVPFGGLESQSLPVWLKGLV